MVVAVEPGAPLGGIVQVGQEESAEAGPRLVAVAEIVRVVEVDDAVSARVDTDDDRQVPPDLWVLELLRLLEDRRNSRQSRSLLLIRVTIAAAGEEQESRRR